MKNTKNTKLPVQGEGVIRDANRTQFEGGLEASGFFSSAWDAVKKYGPGIANAVIG